MGVGISYHSASKYDFSDKAVSEKLPNPNPFNYIINKSYQGGSYLLVDITYPDCTNYEGRKFLLYENVTSIELKRQNHIDPHFSNNKKFYSPIARFEPTEYGWNMAIKLIELLSK